MLDYLDDINKSGIIAEILFKISTWIENLVQTINNLTDNTWIAIITPIIILLILNKIFPDIIREIINTIKYLIDHVFGL